MDVTRLRKGFLSVFVSLLINYRNFIRDDRKSPRGLPNASRAQQQRTPSPPLPTDASVSPGSLPVGSPPGSHEPIMPQLAAATAACSVPIGGMPALPLGRLPGGSEAVGDRPDSSRSADEYDPNDPDFKIFDYRGFQMDTSPDYQSFLHSFVHTQMFRYFIEQRREMRTRDWFELRVFKLLQHRSASQKRFREQPLNGMLFKLGSRIRTWRHRYFELDEMLIVYYEPHSKLLAQTELCATLSQDPSAPMDKATEKQFEALDRLRDEYYKGCVQLIEGQTDLTIPAPDKKYKTSFPFIIDVYGSPDKTHKPRTLICCADSAEQRKLWIQAIRARISSSIIPFKQFEVESTVSERRRLELWQQRMRTMRRHGSQGSAGDTAANN